MAEVAPVGCCQDLQGVQRNLVLMALHVHIVTQPHSQVVVTQLQSQVLGEMLSYLNELKLLLHLIGIWQ